jgi:hypothetical protein
LGGYRWALCTLPPRLRVRGVGAGGHGRALLYAPSRTGRRARRGGTRAGQVGQRASGTRAGQMQAGRGRCGRRGRCSSPCTPRIYAREGVRVGGGPCCMRPERGRGKRRREEAAVVGAVDARVHQIVDVLNHSGSAGSVRRNASVSTKIFVHEELHESSCGVIVRSAKSAFASGKK